MMMNCQRTITAIRPYGSLTPFACPLLPIQLGNKRLAAATILVSHLNASNEFITIAIVPMYKRQRPLINTR